MTNRLAQSDSTFLCRDWLSFFLRLENDMQLRDKIATTKPLILNLANSVTPQRVADVISMVGGSPLVTEASQEIDELLAISQALVINIGTITDEQLHMMIKAGAKANELGIPVVLDPVAVHLPYRSNCVQQLSQAVHFDYIRGNSAEIAWFANEDSQATGIDALDSAVNIATVKNAAQTTGAVIVQSGAIDIISDGKQTVTVDYNNPALATNVGAGDMLSAVVATFASVTDDKFKAGYVAALNMKLAGQKATAIVGNDRPGTYMPVFFDAIYGLTDADISQGVITWH